MAEYDLSLAAWRKSRHSGTNGSCVEVAVITDAWGHAQMIAVRDSKDPGGPNLILAPSQWRAFTSELKRGLSRRQGRRE